MYEQKLGGRMVRKEDPQFSEIVLTFYGVVVVSHRCVSMGVANPTWVLALTAVVGCVWMLPNTPRWTRRASPGRRPQWLRATLHIASFLTLLALFLSGSQLFLLLIGSAFASAGLLGIVSRNIVVGGRTGPPRAYVGWPAIAWSAVFLVSGGFFVHFALSSTR